MGSSGLVILVFAATSGIGAALSSRLAASGARLYITGRDSERLESISREVDAKPLQADVTKLEDVEAAVDEVVAAEKRLDGVVQCAGSLLLKPAHATSEDDWHHTIRTNLDSAFFTVKAAARRMMDKGGSIVLMASAAARTGLANHDAIAAAKAGVIGLTLSAAATYAARGIRVNCVAPGLVRTPMTDPLLASEASRRVSESMHALGRVGTPSEVASAIAWLLAPEQSWVTGQVLGVDGGLATLRSRSKA